MNYVFLFIFISIGIVEVIDMCLKSEEDFYMLLFWNYVSVPCELELNSHACLGKEKYSLFFSSIFYFLY